MHEYFMEYKLAVQKADHIFETALDLFAINSIDIACQHQQGVITESSEVDELILEETGKFIQAIKDFFKKLIDSCKKLIHDATIKFNIAVQSIKVNARLKELKKLMASERARYENKKVNIFNTRKYMKAYTEYISFAVGIYKKVYSKEYNTVEEYEEVLRKVAEADNKKFKELKLNDMEAYVFASTVRDAIEFTEKELDSMDSITRTYEKMWIDAINEIESMTKNRKNSSEISDIKNFASRISSGFSKAFHNIISAPIHKVSVIMKSIGNKTTSSETSE